MSKNKIVYGFKVFNPDWTCRGFQYEVGKTYEMDDLPVCCKKGFHFCLKAADCFNYYNFDSKNKVAEVIVLGETDYGSDDSKCCTNKIQIVREIAWNEVLQIVNTGNYNTGNCNTGNYNTGDWNTGDYNTGDYNTGNYNTGDYNTGDYNTGNWNKSSFNTGCFMTEKQKIFMFNKDSNWTYSDWLHSNARYILNQIPENVVEWIYSDDMTDEEKKEYPTYETTGGYLRVLNKSECCQLWWGSLSDNQKNVIESLPNFNEDIFKEIVGIDIIEN